MARLSTGKRINSASDDAAGVAIASRLSSEIRGTDQAIRNALDGQALIDTAEGGHKEIEAILQRMREVSIQAANDTNGAQDRGNLQAELKALITEIDRIAGVTTWAGNSVMDGGGSTSKTFSLQVGAATGTKNQSGVTIKDMGKTALGISGGATATTISAITDTAGDGTATVKVSASTSTGILTLDPTNANAYKVEIEGQAIVGTATTADTTKALRDASVADLVTQINANTTLTDKGIKAVALVDSGVFASAQAVKITSAGDSSAITFTVSGTNANGESISETIAGGNAAATSTTALFKTVTGITNSGAATGTVKIGGTDDDAFRAAAALTSTGAVEMELITGRIELLHGADDLSSSSKAMHAVTVIDAAIKTVNTQRSELGAVSNRLTHTVSNMTNVSTNLSAARGGIEDADLALETPNRAKNQILQQASTAMLAQANASKQNVLSLLQ